MKDILPMIIPRLIKMICEKDDLSEEKTHEILRSSELYRQLLREETKLWHLSVLTLYELFHEEITTGKITYPEEA
ncbi:MAG: hypothetical protein IKM61_10255 [Eubacteriaceae bacterium]|nr:hypothetical protein [Eubacteriaceae bacterium]